MEWVETTAKTIEEAKSIALDQLGVGDEDAEFEILDEPRPGLFGRMRGEARVRARVRPTRPRPKLERRDRKRKGGSSDDRSDTTDATEDAAPSAKPAGKSGAKSAKSGGTKKAAGSSGKGGSARSAQAADGEGSDAVTSTDATTDAATDDSTNDATNTTDTGRSESSGRARSNQRRASQRSAAGEKAMTDNDTDRHDNDTPAPDAAEVGAAAVTFLTGLVDAFGLEADVTLHDVDDEMEVRVDGENLGIMVGPRGATLLAIQDITRVASQRRLGDHQTRLRIDVAGYREKRREALARFAHKVAADVMESGEERVLEPMPSADRKVIHDTLGDVDGVVTRSEGDDPRRYVVVAPAG